ncbi:MAG: hypothetical protein JKX81_04755 [Arenicella sp.]|nr:hypothetical protein [Arenicella sp.]
MNNRIIPALLCLMFPLSALADCDYIPAPPEVLQQPQLSPAQFTELDPQMEASFAAIDAYKTCVDGEAGQLLPAGASEEDYDSQQYQTAFDTLMQKISSSNEAKQRTIERYNFLIENVSDQ